MLLTVIQSVGVQRISFQTDFGIFLTNAFPLDSYSFMGVFPILNRWDVVSKRWDVGKKQDDTSVTM